MTATQELYDTLYQNLEVKYSVYEALPQEEVDYPFIVLGQIQQVNSNYKTAIGKTLNITIDVWSDSESRFSVDQIMNDIDEISTIGSKNYYFLKRINESDSQILHDNSTEKDLVHGILNLAFTIERKR